MNNINCNLSQNQFNYFLGLSNNGDGYASFVLGCYFHFIVKNYSLMKEFYFRSIEQKKFHALINLANYFLSFEKDEKKANIYYGLALQYDEIAVYVLFNLGSYYCLKKDYKLMKFYFLLAIDYDNADAMFNLGFHYEIVEKDYQLMEKYYLMAIDKGHILAIDRMNKFLESIL
jgi:hypothetical protein